MLFVTTLCWELCTPSSLQPLPPALLVPLDVREEGLQLVVAVPPLLQLRDGELLPLREGRADLDQLVALRTLELEGKQK